MQKNIKIDLIYYSIHKDFEFEFNLCASCQMRLLTEIANDYDSFLHALARGVSRSRVILISAELKRDLISDVSGAIGYTTDKIDEVEFGINSGSCEVIPTGAVPLVTASGVFGGFILERGPQSLIFVSADREIRHEIMLKLVQPYIADLSKTEAITHIHKEALSDTASYVKEDEQAILNAETKADELDDTANIAEEIPKETTAEPEISDSPIPESSESYEENAQDMFDDNVIIYSNDTPEYNETVEPVDFVLDYGTNEKNTEADTPIIDTKKTPKKPNLPVWILSVILVLLILFIVYVMVIEPLLNGTTLADNFNFVFNSLFS